MSGPDLVRRARPSTEADVAHVRVGGGTCVLTQLPHSHGSCRCRRKERRDRLLRCERRYAGSVTCSVATNSPVTCENTDPQFALLVVGVRSPADFSRTGNRWPRRQSASAHEAPRTSGSFRTGTCQPARRDPAYDDCVARGEIVRARLVRTSSCRDCDCVPHPCERSARFVEEEVEVLKAAGGTWALASKWRLTWSNSSHGSSAFFVVSRRAEDRLGTRLSRVRSHELGRKAVTAYRARNASSDDC